jgi:hypothetical protein
MSNHYTIKALGRAWAPSPIHSPGLVSSQSRLNPWPSNNTSSNNNNNSPSPRLHHAAAPTAQEPWHHSLRVLRGRPLERLAILLALLVFTAFLAYHHDRFLFVDSAAHHVWNSSIKNRLRLSGGGGSLIPTWSRVDWSEFAYVTYATTPDYLCNSIMLAESLHRLGAKPETLILYAAELGVGYNDSSSSSSSSPASARLLQEAVELYGARIEPVQVLNSSSATSSSPKDGDSEPTKQDNTWTQSLTKLLAFNQTRYKRVLSLDSDATLLQPMDQLFLLPISSPVALPRAYWLEDTLCTSIMLASPSAKDFDRITARVHEGREGEFDMDVVNALYGDSCLVIPHQPYLLLTGEMRREEHRAYLGSGEEEEEWDVRRVMQEAKYVHFSDWPMPKPWVASSEALKEEVTPKCKATGGEGRDCADRDVWLRLHADFRERRKVSCNVAVLGIFTCRNGFQGRPCRPCCLLHLILTDCD